MDRAALFGLPRRWLGRSLPLDELWFQLATRPGLVSDQAVADAVARMLLPPGETYREAPDGTRRIGCLVVARGGEALASFANAPEVGVYVLQPCLLRAVALLAGEPSGPAAERTTRLIQLLRDHEAREVLTLSDYARVSAPVRARYETTFAIAAEETDANPRLHRLDRRIGTAADPATRLALTQERRRLSDAIGLRVRRRLLGLSPRLISL